MISFLVDSVIGRVVFVFNILCIIIFICCSLNPYLNIEVLLGAGFLGVLFPYALCSLILCFFIDIFIKPRWAIVIVVVLACNWKQIFKFIAPNFYFTSFHIVRAEQKNKTTLRILDWNVKRFLPNNETNVYKSLLTKQHKELIKIYNPDILCFQEFLVKQSSPKNFIKQLTNELGFKYYYFSEDYHIDNIFASGNIIFSKYPIIRKHIVNFESIDAGLESLISVDLQINKNQQIRIFNTHLQSYGFKKEEYDKIALIKNKKDRSLEASKYIFIQMRNTFLVRKQQTNIIKSYIKNTKIPLIMCGDFNDVPNSFTYFELSDNLKDAFLETGVGIGSTFPHLIPTLRIDYILSSKDFKISQFTTIPSDLSDHYPIVSDIIL